jgi:hypothetical protein
VTDLGLREWVEHGQRLGVIGRAAGWWIGDWLRYGNMRFGERYARASRITGYDTQTLMNMAYVASRFDTGERHEALSWSHHAEVAGLAPEERKRLLDLAEAERMSVRCLREEVRRARKLSAPEKRGRLEEQTGGETAPDPELVCPECGCSLAPPVAALAS